MREFVESLLSWPNQVGEFPPAPNPAWKTPSKSTFTLDWGKAMNTDWNSQLPPLFADLFLDAHQQYRGRPETSRTKIIAWFKTHCAYLKQLRKEGLVAKAPEDVRAKRLTQADATRRRGVSRASLALLRSRTNTFLNKLYLQRHQACSNIPELRPFLQTVVYLGPEGMSSDERDPETNVYLIKRIPWRSAGLTKVLRDASRGFKTLLRRSSGSPGRHRVPSSLVDEASQPAKNLAVNGYDSDWKEDLDSDEEAELGASAAMDMTIAPSFYR